MVVITRKHTRRLRAVLRRHALGIAHRGAVPPLVLQADPAAGLRVRHRLPHLAVECLLEGAHRTEEAFTLALDSLADFDGRDESPVTLEAAAPDRVVARWDDRGIPQTREYAVPPLGSLPAFPEPPVAFEECPAGLLDALAEAALTTEEGSTRYALNCIQLRGAAGEVIATDGRQILIQGGFRLPWDGDLLVRSSPIFASRELPRDRPLLVGKTDTHVVLRAGAWTLYLTIQADARFPRVEHVVPDARSATTRLTLDPQDAAFLVGALDRLPGGDEVNSPVTLDCNGRVAVRARAASQDRATELVLARSGYAGEPVRLHTNREYLARAVRLGFAEVQVVGPEDPVACRDGHRAYLWQPLSRESAIGPTDDVVRIDSTAADPPLASTGGPVREPAGSTVNPAPVTNGTHRPATQGSGNDMSPGGLVALVREAEALHQALADAKARTHRLVGALRRERKRSRLVSSTLATLRQIRLQEVVE